VLVSGDTLIAAGVILPLTQFPVADRSLGTRHRAAIGLSEETDALVVVVSEETPRSPWPSGVGSSETCPRTAPGGPRGRGRDPSRRSRVMAR
jgi:hypothetical protein